MKTKYTFCKSGMIQKVVNSFKIETNSENILVKIEEVTFNAEN